MRNSAEKGELESTGYEPALEEHWQILLDLDGKLLTECEEFRNIDKSEIEHLYDWVIDGYLNDEIKREIVVPGYPLRPAGKTGSLNRFSANWQLRRKKLKLGYNKILPFLNSPNNGCEIPLQGFILIEDLLKGKKNIPNILSGADLAYIHSNRLLYESKVCTYIAMTGDYDIISSFIDPGHY
jgi:hypothetical protein